MVRCQRCCGTGDANMEYCNECPNLFGYPSGITEIYWNERIEN